MKPLFRCQALALFLSLNSCFALTLKQADALHSEALQAMQRGDNASVVQKLRQVLPAWETHLGATDDGVALCASQLGAALIQISEHAKARPHLERSLKLRQLKLGADHKSVVLVKGNLALACRKTWDFPAALGYLNELVVTQKKAGPLARRELADLNERIGTVHKEAGDHPAAFHSFEACLALRAKGDPANEATHFWAGEAADASKDYVGALRHYRANLAMSETSRPSTSYQVRMGYYWVGRALHSLGRESEALTPLERSYELFLETPGTSEAQTKDVATVLAETTRALGLAAFGRAEYQPARGYLKRAAELRSKFSADQPGAGARLLRELGTVQRRLGDAAAVATLKQAVALSVEAHGEEAVETVLPRELLAMALAENGDLAKAKSSLKTVRRIRTAGGTDSAPWYRGVKAVLLDFAKKPKKSVKLFQAALKEMKKTADPNLVGLLAEYRTFLQRHGKKTAAERVTKRLLGLRAQMLGDEGRKSTPQGK